MLECMSKINGLGIARPRSLRNRPYLAPYKDREGARGAGAASSLHIRV